MNKIYKTLIIAFFIGIFAWVGYITTTLSGTDTETNIQGQASQTADIIGTQVGTTTEALQFAVDNDRTANQATTTAVKLLEGTTDTGLFTIRAVTASTTAELFWHIYGSNDGGCDTTTTTTETSGLVLMNQIHWYELSASVEGTGSSVSGQIIDPNASTVASSTEILLTNLNWACLKMEMSGASTTAHVQLRQKTNN